MMKAPGRKFNPGALWFFHPRHLEKRQKGIAV